MWHINYYGIAMQVVGCSVSAFANQIVGTWSAYVFSCFYMGLSVTYASIYIAGQLDWPLCYMAHRLGHMFFETFPCLVT